MFLLHFAHLSTFWQLYPALLYGLAAYIGAAYALQPHPLLAVPLLFVFGAQKARVMLALTVMCAVFCFVSSTVSLPPAAQDHWRGIAVVEVQDITQELQYTKEKTGIRLQVISFQADTSDFKNFSCKMQMAGSQDTLRGGTCYSFAALLTRTKGNYFLRPLEPPQVQADNLFSMVEWRYRAKRAFSKFLAAHMPPGKGRTFLEGCVSGSFNDASLSDALWCFGLQHITVVSGFHFSLAAACITLLVGLFLSWRKTIWVVFLMTTGYMVFVGPSPSVLRAYISIVVCSAAQLLGKKASGLNSLGIGLLAVILYNPTYIYQLSFQLSFLAAFSILLLYPLFHQLVTERLSRFSLHELLPQGFFDHAAYIIRSWFVESIALLLAVHFMVVPLLLHVFQVVPLAGILYNCFFPFLVSLGMSFMVVSMLSLAVPFLASGMFWLLNIYLEWLLGLILYAPKVFHGALSIEQFPLEWAVIIISLLAYVGIVFHSQENDRPLLKWI